MPSKSGPAPGRFHRIDRQRAGQSLGRLLVDCGRDYNGTARILSRSLSTEVMRTLDPEPKSTFVLLADKYFMRNISVNGEFRIANTEDI